MLKTFEEILKEERKLDSCSFAHLDIVKKVFTEYLQQFKGKYYEEVEIKNMDDLPKNAGHYVFIIHNKPYGFEFKLSDDLDWFGNSCTAYLRPITLPIAEQQEIDWEKLENEFEKIYEKDESESDFGSDFNSGLDVAFEWLKSKLEGKSLGGWVNKREIICMCGSTRYADLMAVISWEFEKLGKIVLRVNYVPEWYGKYKGYAESAHMADQEGLKKNLDELHFRKIDMCDKVFVCNYDNYIGESTRNEINYAISKNKPIEYITGENELSETLKPILKFLTPKQ